LSTRRRYETNPDTGQLAQLAALAGAGLAGYFLLYVPWAQRRALEELTRAAILANQAKGMGVADAAAHAIAGACTAGAAVYKMPPAVAGPLCQGVGLVAVKGAQAAAKGAVIVGKLTGRGAKAVGQGVGKGASAVGKGVGKGARKAFKSIFSDLGLGALAPRGRGARARTRGAEYYTRHF
jgi:hypothetical protein